MDPTHSGGHRSLLKSGDTMHGLALQKIPGESSSSLWGKHAQSTRRIKQREPTSMRYKGHGNYGYGH